MAHGVEKYHRQDCNSLMSATASDMNFSVVSIAKRTTDRRSMAVGRRSFNYFSSELQGSWNADHFDVLTCSRHAILC